MRLDDLNPAQRAAVTTLRGPLLLLAGAGTGKTRVITYRIARLIERGTRPERILAVTFTNKAAREMKERALALLREGQGRGQNRHARSAPEISTFHSLCVRILRRNIRRLGYPERFAIYDRGDQESLARQALREIRVGHETLRPGDLLHWIGTWKSQGAAPEQAEELAVHTQGDKALLAALAYGKYQAALRAAGAVDFDDLLLLTEQVLSRFAEARSEEAGRFDHILIDEYQDTNALQYRIVCLLAVGHRNLCVVGDDDQSIYGWRGAEVTHILNFQRDWPEARVIKLEENYRCRAPILDLANTLISRNRTRHDKTLRPARPGGEPPRFLRCDDDQLEAQTVAHEVLQLLQGTANRTPAHARDIAVLFRTNEQTGAFEVELRRLRIAYVVVGGTSFFDRREVKDLLSYLRTVAHPADEVSLLRVINCPPRGIGAASVQRLLALAVASGVPLWQVLTSKAVETAELGPGVASRVGAFCALIHDYQQRFTREPIAEALRALVEEVGYRAEVDRQYTKPGEAEARFAAIENLIQAAAHYSAVASEPSLLGFLDECTLGGREDLADQNDETQLKDAVVLMTLHSAKGLEFDHVFLVGMEEGLLPHHRSIAESSGAGIEEERRLCYVGVTRARDTLTLTRARSRTKWGRPQPCIPSRFLLEMRGDDERAKKSEEAAKALFFKQAASTLAAPDATGNEAPKAARRKATKSAGKARRTSRAKGPAKPRASGKTRQ
jgi:DNA helicase II / ATP-dependent DNA helicase PcrA